MKNLESELDRFRPLWEESREKYVLLQTVAESQDPATCLVFDLEAKTALIVEDDVVSRELMKRLIEKGFVMKSAKELLGVSV